MSVFHMTDDGPKPCAAAPGNCPVGGKHFTDSAAAQAEYEEHMRSIAPLVSHKASNGGKSIAFNQYAPEVTEALAAAPIYRKEAAVEMRIAEPGERLSTVLADGTVETVRTLLGGEHIITNPSGEEYAVDERTFADRYVRHSDGSWTAIGRVRAVRNPTGSAITILAPWGEEQHGGADCFIAENPEHPEDRYIIGATEFAATYKPENASVSDQNEKSGQMPTTDAKMPQKPIRGRMMPMKGRSYYGTKVNQPDIEPCLESWREHVGEDAASAMERAKIERDGGYAFHVTILSPQETRKLRKAKIAIPDDFSPEMSFTGVGTVSDGDKTAWFVTVESEQVQSWRDSVGLARKDLHVTIGFIGGDVHNQSKGADTVVIS